MMHYEYSGKVSAAECHRKLCQRYGDGIVSLRTVEEWYRRFKSGATTLQDKPRSGCSTVVNDHDLLAAIDKDRNLTTRELGEMLGISRQTVSDALKRLNLSFKFNRWVLHVLSSANKHNRAEACRDLLRQHEECPILDRIVTCDEKWIYYDNVSRVGGWSKHGQPVGESARRMISNKKVLLCVWWDKDGVIYKEYLKSGETISEHNYPQMLRNVRAELLKTRPALVNRKKVLFYQDNARPHICTMTRQVISELKWEVMTHPPYSPDLAPLNYYLFSHLQLYLKGTIFRSTEEVISEVDDFFSSRSRDFFKKGIYKLPKRWQKVVEIEGEYYPH